MVSVGGAIDRVAFEHVGNDRCVAPVAVVLVVSIEVVGDSYVGMRASCALLGRAVPRSVSTGLVVSVIEKSSVAEAAWL